MAKLAIVTGASGGIGSAIVTRLIHDGYAVIGMARDDTKMARLADTLPVHRFHQVLMDVTSSQSIWYSRMLDLVSEYGTPEVLVIAHGAAPVIAPTVSLEASRFCEVLLTDVYGAFIACQSVGGYMVRARRGSIIVISSLHAKMTYPQRLAYSVAKSGLSGLVRSLALEWGPSNVRTNAILPWQVRGPRSQAFMDAAKAEGKDLEELYKQRSPMRRLVEPVEVAEAVMFLASNLAMNGCELVMDGGVSGSMWYQGFAEETRRK